MTSRVSWSVEGIEPSVRDRAEAAAQRAGMSLSDWISSTLGDSRPRGSADVSEIHQRLDAITRHIEQISQVTPRREGGGVARQLNEAISRLDARLAQISQPPRSEPAAAARPAARPDHTMAPREEFRREEPARRPSATTLPELLEFDVAEIQARQRQLLAETARPAIFASPPPSPQPAPREAAPDLSGFEKQLQYLTSQIESLRRSDGVEEAIATFRSELAEMRAAISEALPRHALEGLEAEIRTVARRIDESHQSGVDSKALQSIEQALRDIYDTLRTLTPAEQLAGFDEAIRNLSGRIDALIRTSPDAGAMQQLEGTIGALREIVGNVASGDTLARLSDDVHNLGARLEELAAAGAFSASLGALEERIAALTESLQTRDRPSGDGDSLETAVRTLSERIDRLSVGSDAPAAFAHLEQRVVQLLERLEQVEARPAALGRVEDGLNDILGHLEQQRASFARLSEAAAPQPAMDQDVVDAIRRELSGLRLSCDENDRNTQDALESVHTTLGHVVDRLAAIEGDLRDARTERAAAEVSARPLQPERFAPIIPEAPPIISSTALSAPMPTPRRNASPRLELPNPAVAAAPMAARDIDTQASNTISDILQAARGPVPLREVFEPRAPLAPELPPDFPLEPGTRMEPRDFAPSTPSERIAASEQVLSEIPASAPQPATTSNFIAAARRAAQAAASHPGAAAKDQPARSSFLGGLLKKTGAKAASRTKPETRVEAKIGAKIGAKARTKVEPPAEPNKSEFKADPRAEFKVRPKPAPAAPARAAPPANGLTISSKIRSLLVGASVVVIVLSGFKMAVNLLDGGDHAAVERSVGNSSEAMLPLTSMTAPARSAAELTLPSVTAPTPMTHQVPVPADVTGSIAPAPASESRAATAAPTLSPPGSIMRAPVSDTIPESIGGPMLRSAALKGDPAAAYEVGVRYAEGRGVAVNYEEAAKWYDRAADGGIVPAMFRLGTLFEKGLGGRKDVDAARRYYIRAAERGNAKAMHNLAVLEADGGARGPNYKLAAQWFLKAAERGVGDSQFNLGILYARGIGVDQNLAESYKWFSLAAAQGDADAGRKRDDVAKRLDAQSLAAAKLAIQTFSAEAQPADATTVAAPAGGWDAVPPPAPTTTRRPARPAAGKTPGPSASAR